MTQFAKELGIEYPLFAFSHCRDVVAAVSRAGGMGVLGVLAMTPEQIDAELAWLESNIGGKPYGVDVVMPVNTTDRQEGLTDSTTILEDLNRLIPPGHREYADTIMRKHGIPTPAESAPRLAGRGLTSAHGAAQLDAVLAHDIPLLVSALGAPPAEAIDRAHRAGARVGTLIGKPEHIEKSRGTGIDVYIAQSYEAGGHTGEIGSMVLIPDAVDAADGTPVLAAGGIGSGRQMAAALALGAAGAWTGSIWLTTQESHTDQAVKERMLGLSATDTVRSRSQTGKPNRQIRTPWTQAWDDPTGPGNLPMPLQQMLYSEYTERARAAGVWELVGSPVGQIVGRMNSIRSTENVVLEIVEEFAATLDRMAEVRDELLA